MTRRWSAPATLVGALAFILFVGWRCPLRTATGYPCPGCGMTRATRMLLHGDFAGATTMHPLVWIVVPMVSVAALIEIRGYLRTQEWGASQNVPYAKALMFAVAALMFVVWLIRLGLGTAPT